MITKTSPAKVNLFLRIIRKRPDGYHDILSLMQRISLSDEMTFSPAGSLIVRCPGGDLPENEDNIVYRAARAFFLRCALPAGVEITIKKNIPIAAGLGGGSSNAATTLTTLNGMFGNPLTTQDLMEIGRRLGADVPFFIFEKPAWAEGIGERLTEAGPLPPFWLLLINPGFAVSTKMVYEALNLRLTNERINYSIPRFSTLGDVILGFTNDLEKVTLKLYPVLDRIKTLLMMNGAQGALMSGSGPTVFGIFADEPSAIRAQSRLTSEGKWSVFRSSAL